MLPKIHTQADLREMQFNVIRELHQYYVDRYDGLPSSIRHFTVRALMVLGWSRDEAEHAYHRAIILQESSENGNTVSWCLANLH